MGYSKIQLKCLECGDIIESIYDSRINMKNNRSICKCGKLEFTTENRGSFSYKRDAKYEKIDNVYYETIDDYFIVTDKIKGKINRIRDYFNDLKIKHVELDFVDYDYYNNVEEIEILIDQDFKIVYGYFNDVEVNEFKLELSFYRYDRYKQDDEIETDMVERINKFYTFLEMIDKNPDIIKNRKYLWNECDLIRDANRDHLKLYNYEFVF